jgi:DNA-binding transcriptional MerR regulator
MTTMLKRAGEAVANNNNNNDATMSAEEEFVRIGEMARKYGVTLRALRFYEDKGLIAPKREGSTRLYSRRDNARLKLILLGRKIGFSLRDVKQIMDLYDPSGANIKQLRLALDKSEKQMARLQKQRAVIDDAVGELSNLMADVRAKLADRTPVSAVAAR